MDDFIPKGNIERFEQRLQACRDESERRVLKELLAVERRRLEAARLTKA